MLVSQYWCLFSSLHFPCINGKYVDKNELFPSVPTHQSFEVYPLFLGNFAVHWNHQTTDGYQVERNLDVLCTRFVHHCTKLCLHQWIFLSEISFNMCAWCRCTRRHFESTHGGVWEREGEKQVRQHKGDGYSIREHSNNQQKPGTARATARNNTDNRAQHNARQSTSDYWWRTTNKKQRATTRDTRHDTAPQNKRTQRRTHGHAHVYVYVHVYVGVTIFAHFLTKKRSLGHVRFMSAVRSLWPFTMVSCF